MRLLEVEAVPGSCIWSSLHLFTGVPCMAALHFAQSYRMRASCAIMRVFMCHQAVQLFYGWRTPVFLTLRHQPNTTGSPLLAPALGKVLPAVLGTQMHWGRCPQANVTTPPLSVHCRRRALQLRAVVAASFLRHLGKALLAHVHRVLLCCISSRKGSLPPSQNSEVHA